jgi:hypothetical protein
MHFYVKVDFHGRQQQQYVNYGTENDLLPITFCELSTRPCFGGLSDIFIYLFWSAAKITNLISRIGLTH